MSLKIEPGTQIWVVERNASGKAFGVNEYMLLAQSGEFVIASSYLEGIESAEDALAYYARETIKRYDVPLLVFREEDCYRDRASAWAAKDRETQDEQEV